jgi:hypothetical protein
VFAHVVSCLISAFVYPRECLPVVDEDPRTIVYSKPQRPETEKNVSKDHPAAES